MIKGEGEMPDEAKKAAADKIRQEKAEGNLPIEGLSDDEVLGGVVYSSETRAHEEDEPTNKFEALIKAVVEDIDIPSNEPEIKDKNKGTADAGKPEDAEGVVLDEGADASEDSKPIDVKNNEEESPVSKDMEAIFIDAADLLQAGDLEGVQRIMDSYENDDGFKLELTKEMQRRLDAVKRAEAEDVSTKNVDKSEDKPKTKRDPAGGIAHGAKDRLNDELAKAAETMDAMKRNSEGTGDAETHDEVAPETSPEAGQKDEEQAETFEAPDDASSVVQLFDKLAEYKQRAKDIKAEAEAKGEKMPDINYTDAKYKEYVLSRVLDGGEYDVETLIEEYQETNDDSLNLQLFRSAVSVIQDYIETGGINVGFSTGLASSERLVEVLDGLENSSTPTEKWSESLQKAFKELRPDAERPADKQERDLKRVKGELDEDAKKAGGEAEDARLNDDGGTPRGVEVPAESKEKDGETPPEPKDKVTREEWLKEREERIEADTEGLTEDEEIAYRSLITAYAYGGKLSEHAKEHIDLLRGTEVFDSLLELMSEASENGGNQEFQETLLGYLKEKEREEWPDEREILLEAVLKGLTYDEKLAAESLVRAYAAGGEWTENAKKHIDLLRGHECFHDLLELMRKESKHGDNQEFQDDLNEYLSGYYIEADFEKYILEYLDAEEEGNAKRMEEIKDAINALLDENPDKLDLFLEVSERIEEERNASSELSEGVLKSFGPKEAARYLSDAGDEIGKAILGIGMGLDGMARKSGAYAAAGRGLGVLAFLAGGLSWLAYKGAKMALNYAYKRASKYTPPGLKKVFDKMIESSAQPSKGGGKSTGKK